MKMVLIRWFFPPLLCLVLAACSLPEINLSAKKETEFFAEGLDRYVETGDLTLLKRLPHEYPQGEWRSRAEGLIEIAEQQQQQQSLLKNKSRQLAHARQEKEVLFQDNQMLEVTLERLKQVLIDMELKSE